MYIYTCMRTNTYVHICVYTYTHVHFCLYIYSHTHAHNVKDILAFWTGWYVKGKEVATAHS